MITITDKKVLNLMSKIPLTLVIFTRDYIILRNVDNFIEIKIPYSLDIKKAIYVLLSKNFKTIKNSYIKIEIDDEKNVCRLYTKTKAIQIEFENIELDKISDNLEGKLISLQND
ncbi:MAG: hypothetical protein QW474_02965, partial [Candidatus Aenigmatarchaeota archaeon]